jgi:hypothetical protein
MSGKRFFVNFGDNRYIKSRDRIVKEMEYIKKEKDGKDSFFDEFITETENICNEEGFKKILNNVPSVLGTGRGYYWYMWKPYIIYKHMMKMNDGDILFYCDSGMKVADSDHVRVKFQNMLELVSDSEKCPTGIATFITTGHPKDRFEYMYNQIAVFKHFGVENDQEITHSQQIQAGVSMFYKSKKSMEIVEQWYNLARDFPQLFTGDPRVHNILKNQGPQMKGFRDHRHDQSVWSVLCKIHKVNILKHNINPVIQTHYRQ